MKPLNFKSFFDVAPLLEDVQAAKAYLVKKYAEEKKIEPAKIKDAEKKEILDDPMFLEIKKMLEDKKSGGYALSFVKFWKDQGANIGQLNDLLTEILRRKNILNRLSRTIVEYSNLVRPEGGLKEGYELLLDELGTLDAGIAYKKLYNMLSKNFKETIISIATPAQLKELEAAAASIEALPPKKRQDGRTYTYWDDFGRKTGKYENNARDKAGKLINAYPMFNDKKFALSEFIANTKDDVKNWGSTLDQVVDKMKSMTTQCKVMYYQKGFLVVSIRTFEAQKEFSKALDWCIGKYLNFWESYVDTEDNVQINIINGNLPSDNLQPFYVVGYTVKESRIIRNSFDRNNVAMGGAVGSDFIGYLRNKFKDVVQTVKDTTIRVPSFGSYPSDLIDTIEYDFKQEASIKAALKRYFGKGKGLSPTEIITSLITFTKGFLSGSVSEEEWTDISGIVADIVAQYEHINKKEFIKVFLSSGLTTEAMWNVFDQIIGPGVLSADEVEEIREVTMRVITDAVEMHAFMSGRAKQREKDSSHIRVMELVIHDKDYTIKRLAEL